MFSFSGISAFNQHFGYVESLAFSIPRWRHSPRFIWHFRSTCSENMLLVKMKGQYLAHNTSPESIYPKSSSHSNHAMCEIEIKSDVFGFKFWNIQIYFLLFLHWTLHVCAGSPLSISFAVKVQHNCGIRYNHFIYSVNTKLIQIQR